MTLREYLHTHRITESAFARIIGTSQAAVSRYCSTRVPAPDQMRAIVQATQGAVTARDFEGRGVENTKMVLTPVPCTCSAGAAL